MLASVDAFFQTQAAVLPKAFDLRLVTLSLLVAVLASFAALNLGSRSVRTSGYVRWFWTITAGTALGGGIWSMHFIGMIALRLPIPVRYALTPVISSAAVAIAGSTAAIAIGITFARRKNRQLRLWVAAFCMGITISGMYYTGMYAMRGQLSVQHDAWYVTISVCIAIFVSYCALLLTSLTPDDRANRQTIRRNIFASITMGLAISGFHYTGMYGASFSVAPDSAQPSYMLATLGLAIGIAIFTVLTLLKFCISAIVTRRLNYQERLLIQERHLRANSEAAELITQNQTTKLDASNRAKVDFLANISHEVRTPLNAIAGYTELMLLGLRGPLNEGQRDDLSRMQRSQRHLLSIVTDVLHFAKLDSGTVQYDLEDLPVDSLVENALVLVQPKMVERNIICRVVSPNVKLSMRGDGKKVTQILVNILSNAVKFTPKSGKITIRWIKRGCEVIISIRDTGIGIGPENITSIFKPFVQVRDSLTRSQDGIGLGLPISWEYANSMRGDLSVISTPGKGSIFFLRMPLSRPVDGDQDLATPFSERRENLQVYN